MKILFDYQIFHNQEYGGPSKYYYNLAREIITNKDDLRVCAPIHINKYLNKLPKSNVYGINTYNRLLSYLPSRIRSKFNELLIHKVNKFASKKYIKEFEPDIVHNTYYENCEKTKIPTVLTVYDLIHEKYYELYGKKKDYRPKQEAIKNADQIICISQNTMRDLNKYYDVQKKKIKVIYLASDIIDQEKLFSAGNVETKFNNFLLFVGKRSGYKNFENFLKAYSDSFKLRKNFKIICFGGGQFRKSEKETFKNLRLNQKNIIQMSGNDDLLYQLYKNARALIYPSLYEGFGLPILEAMSLNCPVICSNTSSLPEVAGDAASYFNPYNFKEIQEVIEKNIYSDDYLDKLKNLGKERVKLFSWKKCGQETLNCYSQLIS